MTPKQKLTTPNKFLFKLRLTNNLTNEPSFPSRRFLRASRGPVWVPLNPPYNHCKIYMELSNILFFVLLYD